MEKKFRGQRIDGKGWVYGDLIHQGDRALIHKSTDEWKMFGIEEESEIVIPKTVGQFIRKDQCGTDIYAGDLFMNGESIRIIEILGGNACAITHDRTEAILLSFIIKSNPKNKVIGTIHDKK